MHFDSWGPHIATNVYDKKSAIRVSSIRSKQGVFLIFSVGWIWVEGVSSIVSVVPSAFDRTLLLRFHRCHRLQIDDTYE